MRKETPLHAIHSHNMWYPSFPWTNTWVATIYYLPELNNTLGTLLSFMFASSGVFLPFFELHLAQAVTCYRRKQATETVKNFLNAKM
jgi:hypothetical protein